MVFLVNPAERPVGLVGERRLPGVQFEFLDQLGEFLLGELGPLGQYLSAFVLPPLDQHAFQAADDDDRQDDVLVFVRLELATQSLGGLPDIPGEIVEFGFIERERHEKRAAYY